MLAGGQGRGPYPHFILREPSSEIRLILRLVKLITRKNPGESYDSLFVVECFHTRVILVEDRVVICVSNINSL